MRSGSKISSRNTSGSSGVSGFGASPTAESSAADTPVARSSRTITANATRLMQNLFSILRYFICFAPITVYARKQADRTGSFCAKQKEKTVWLHFSH